MKKKTRTFLTLTICAALLTGCGTSDSNSSDSPSPTGVEQSSTPNVEYSLKETVVADNDYYTLTALGAEADEADKCIVEFQFTNKTSYDMALDISSMNTYINRCAASYADWEDEGDICYADADSSYAKMNEAAGIEDGYVLGLGAAAGESGTAKYAFSLPDGTSVAEEIIFVPELVPQHSSEDPGQQAATNPIPYEQLSAMNPEQECTIYPTGLSADTVDFPSYEPAEGEQVVADNENFTYIIRGLEGDDDGSMYTLHTYMENKSEEPLSTSWEDVSVNGYTSEDMTLGDYIHDLPAGRRIFSDVVFFPNAEKTYGLAEGEYPEELSFTLEILHWVEVNGAGSYESLYSDSFTCSFGK